MLWQCEAERLSRYSEAAVWCRNCAANVDRKTRRAADIMVTGEPRRRSKRQVSSCEISRQRCAAPRGIAADLPGADAQLECGQHQVFAVFGQAQRPGQLNPIAAKRSGQPREADIYCSGIWGELPSAGQRRRDWLDELALGLGTERKPSRPRTVEIQARIRKIT